MQLAIITVQKMTNIHVIQVLVFWGSFWQFRLVSSCLFPRPQYFAAINSFWLSFRSPAFGIIYATDPPIQNMTKIVCLRRLNSDIFNYKLLQTVLTFVHQFFKIRVVFHMLEVCDTIFFCISNTNSLSDGVTVLKKSVVCKMFA